MSERPPGLDDLLNYVTERLEGPDKCNNCGQPFDPEDTRFDGLARHHRKSEFCRRCVDHCHDTEIADHRCGVCR